MAAMASFMFLRRSSATSTFEPYSRAKLWKARPTAASFDCADSPDWLKATHSSGNRPGVFSKHWSTEFAKHVFPKFASPGNVPSASCSLTTSRATGFTRATMAFWTIGKSNTFAFVATSPKPGMARSNSAAEPAMPSLADICVWSRHASRFGLVYGGSASAAAGAALLVRRFASVSAPRSFEMPTFVFANLTTVYVCFKI
mmetsp:Transcript_98716/g.260556  ORF Transcript_98716/g.260556 Transcript_98716/m.260556 type:complete len:200 (+) Transcript_98716:910-1509(+)